MRITLQLESRPSWLSVQDVEEDGDFTGLLTYQRVQDLFAQLRVEAEVADDDVLIRWLRFDEPHLVERVTNKLGLQASRVVVHSGCNCQECGWFRQRTGEDPWHVFYKASRDMQSIAIITGRRKLQIWRGWKLPNPVLTVDEFLKVADAELDDALAESLTHHLTGTEAATLFQTNLENKLKTCTVGINVTSLATAISELGTKYTYTVKLTNQDGQETIIRNTRMLRTPL